MHACRPSLGASNSACTRRGARRASSRARSATGGVWPGWQSPRLPTTQGGTCERSGTMPVGRTRWLHASEVLLGQLMRNMACARHRRCNTCNTDVPTCTSQRSSSCRFLLEAAATPGPRDQGSARPVVPCRRPCSRPFSARGRGGGGEGATLGVVCTQQTFRWTCWLPDLEGSLHVCEARSSSLLDPGGVGGVCHHHEVYVSFTSWRARETHM